MLYGRAQKMKSKNPQSTRVRPPSRVSVAAFAQPRFDTAAYPSNWTWWDADTKLAYRLHVAALFDRAGRKPLPQFQKALRLVAWLQKQRHSLSALPGGRDDYFNDPATQLVDNCIYALQRSLEDRIAQLEAAVAASQRNPQNKKGKHA